MLREHIKIIIKKGQNIEFLDGKMYLCAMILQLFKTAKRVALLLILILVSACNNQALSKADEENDYLVDDSPIVVLPPAQIPTIDPDRTYRLPVDTRPALAGNYGELRPNHFHAGLDFKTNQTIGHPVYAFSDGYVARIGINAYGYGLVVYLFHPAEQLTSVYAHLSSFSEAIWTKIRERQVRDSLNNADITFAPYELPVAQGDVVALSGNTGSSGGPHVHFELRGPESATGADDEEWYDPMPYFRQQLTDTQAPRVSQFYLYPAPGEGVADAKARTAWGRVGLAIKAYDYMDGQVNKYGLKRVRLFQQETDGTWKLIFHWNQDFFQYSEQRYTNSTIDYAAWKQQRSMIMKSFIEPGNRLRMFDTSVGDGYVLFDEERPYHFRYELEDAHGNICRYPVKVQGQRRPIPARPAISGIEARHDASLWIDSLGMHFHARPGIFYTDLDLTFSATRAQVTPCMSLVYSIGASTIPLHDYCDMAIDLADSISADMAPSLYLSHLDGGSVRGTYVPANSRRPAQYRARVRELGRYAVRRDTIPPTAELIGRPSIRSITFSMDDADSGISRWRLIIDGKFVPLNKINTGKMVAEPLHYGILPDREHEIQLSVWDLCDNHQQITLKRRF